MIERVIDFSVRRRWLILLVALAAAASGFWSLTKLPIDAVPDVTNVQVQINATAPALTPVEIEKQVTVALETALAGTPGLESTRSFSRNGFAQITAVFTDRTDIYFARQQVAERINEAKNNLPPGVEVRLGPISTGLGEIYWWAVEYAKPGAAAPVHDGRPGWQTDGTYLTPEGERLTDDFQRARSGPTRQLRAFVQSGDCRHRSQQCQPGRQLYRAERRRLCGPGQRARGKHRRHPADRRDHTRQRSRPRQGRRRCRDRAGVADR